MPNCSGPLAGVRILEVESIGPGPFAAMLLADLGASVLTISRPGPQKRGPNAVLYRNRAGSVSLDLKTTADRQRFLDLIDQADGLIEGYRPGVMERLDLAPDTCLERNNRLVFGRITGWGRHGPLARTAGHDINYIALSGALHACGTAESGPVPPLNLIGDFGGGGLMLAFGMVCALLEARGSGHGQVVDAAMLDGASSLMAMMWGMKAVGRWPAARAGNLFDGSAWFYRCYRCADDNWVAVGCIEMSFRVKMLQLLNFEEAVDDLARSDDQSAAMHTLLADTFRRETRAHWQALFEQTDACVTPVLSMDEAHDHPQNLAWGSLQHQGGVIAPAPAPRFSRSHPQPTQDSHERLALWQLSES